MSQRWRSSIKFGFAVHLVGVFADGLMVARVKLAQNKVFSSVALASVTVYTLAFVAWLIYVEVVRFDHGGKVCSGYYLTSEVR